MLNSEIIYTLFKTQNPENHTGSNPPLPPPPHNDQEPTEERILILSSWARSKYNIIRYHAKRLLLFVTIHWRFLEFEIRTNQIQCPQTNRLVDSVQNGDVVRYRDNLYCGLQRFPGHGQLFIFVN